MRNFQETFETRKQSFISAFSIYVTVLLIAKFAGQKIKDFFSKYEFSPDLLTFTKEILNRKLHYLCSDYSTLHENTANMSNRNSLNKASEQRRLSRKFNFRVGIIL